MRTIEEIKKQINSGEKCKKDCFAHKLTNEKIIIDRIDVSECKYFKGIYKEDSDIEINNCCCANYIPCSSKYNYNCDHKQLKRKEQECECYKHQAELGNETTNILTKQLEEQAKECEELKNEIAFGSNGKLSDEIRATVFKDLNDENLKYKQTLDEIEKYCVQNKHSGWVDVEGIIDIINKIKEQ